MDAREFVEKHWDEVKKHEEENLSYCYEVAKENYHIDPNDETKFDMEVLKYSLSRLRAYKGKAPMPNPCDEVFKFDTPSETVILRKDEPDLDRDVLEFELECLMAEVSDPNEKSW